MNVFEVKSRFSDSNTRRNEAEVKLNLGGLNQRPHIFRILWFLARYFFQFRNLNLGKMDMQSSLKLSNITRSTLISMKGVLQYYINNCRESFSG